jgi:3D (Asp-Asp-Asp) domain-containing protein
VRRLAVCVLIVTAFLAGPIQVLPNPSATTLAALSQSQVPYSIVERLVQPLAALASTDRPHRPGDISPFARAEAAAETEIDDDSSPFANAVAWAAAGGDRTALSAESDEAAGCRSRSSPPARAVIRIRRVCRVTAYHDRGTTASGVQSGVGQCAAPIDIPFGTEVYIPSLGRKLIATDRTHKRFRHNTVDIFIPTREQCLQFGRRYLEVEFTIPADALARNGGSRLASR